MLDRADARASVDQSVRLPDYFSCKNCIAYKGYYLHAPNHPLAGKNGDVNMCYILQDRGTCAKKVLANAVAAGNVQIHLHFSDPGQPPRLTGGGL